LQHFKVWAVTFSRHGVSDVLTHGEIALKGFTDDALHLWMLLCMLNRSANMGYRQQSIPLH